MADEEENTEMNEMNEMDSEDIETKTIKKKPAAKKIVKKTAGKDVKELKVKEHKASKVMVEHKVREQKQTDEITGADENQSIFSGGVVLVLALLVGILFYNQILLFELSTYAGVSAPVALSNVLPGGSISLSESEKVSYGPALLAQGEQPAIAGYRTKMKEFPTVSATPKKPKTGDVVQDALNKIVPTGTPEYGKEAGVSFDDPVNSLARLGELENIVSLTPEQEKRWNKIIGSFTCDYCCGAPQQPTIINRCGCAHAAGWRGIAKFLIGKYGDKITDEQVMGEMTKWKALWYPGPTVQRFIQEQATGNAGGAPVKLDQLPQMVGGC